MLRSSVGAIFVPADRFFMRLVPLAPDTPALAQAELALESFAPFPPAQLYWGCCVLPDQAQALVYAAHRRRFTTEEAAVWEKHDLAVPALIALLGTPPPKPGLRVLVGTTSLSGVAWKEPAGGPAAVHSREYGETPTEAIKLQFSAELAAKAGLSDARTDFLTATPVARRERERLIFECVGENGEVLTSTVLSWADQDALDVRDRTFLGQRRRERRRSEFVWRLMLAGTAALALALILDATALLVGLVERTQQARVTAQAPLVKQLDTAQSLNSRIDELTRRRLRFFEMLSAINSTRPAGVRFLRTNSSQRNGIEVDAQTGNADEASAFETALRQMPALEKVTLRDVRTSGGVTNFSVSVVFKPEPVSGGAQ